MRAQLAPRAATSKSSASAGTAQHGVPGHSSAGTVCAPGLLRTSTPRRGWSWCRGPGQSLYSQPGHRTGWHLKVHPGEQCQCLPEPAPAPAFGSWSGILLPEAAWPGEEGAGQAPEASAMPSAPGKVSIPGRGGLSRLAAPTPSPADTSVSGHPWTISHPLTPPPPALSQLLSHQPSRSQGSSPLLKAKCKETALYPHQVLCQGSSCPPPPRGLACPGEQLVKGKAGTRSQQQRGQGRWKRGRSPPSRSC